MSEELVPILNGEVVQADLDELAVEIRDAHEACVTSAEDAVRYAIKAGERLIAAKQGIEHGGWGKWLAANFEFAPETARGYMRIASKWGTSPDLPSSINTALKEISEAREEQARIDALPEDLAERVRTGAITLDEALVIQQQNAEQVRAWAEEIKQALGVLRRMAGHPIPDALAAHLSKDENAALAAVLSHLKTGIDA